VNSSVAEIGQVAQRNAVTSEESAAAAAEVDTQIEHLRRLTADLARIVSGADPAAPVLENHPQPASGRLPSSGAINS